MNTCFLDSCVRQASRCVRTAKLVALQLHFLNRGSELRVVNLRPAELLNAVTALPRCYQVFVVSEAYSYSPDWAEILYQKVILNGDFVYLEELKRHRPLTSTLFEDIFKKFQQLKYGGQTQSESGCLSAASRRVCACARAHLQYWTDFYLRWNVSDYPGVTNVRFPDSQIWRPDILLYNSADERFDASFHTNILVNSTGYCQYLPPGIFKSTCYIDVRWFPFDVQRCDLKFGSWTYGGWSLDLQMIEADVTGYIANGEWDLVGESPRSLFLLPTGGFGFWESFESYNFQFVYTDIRQEDEQGERGDEDAGDQQVESVVERPPPHHHGEGHVGVRLLAAVVETLAPPPGNRCRHNTTNNQGHRTDLCVSAQYFATTMVIVGLSVIATVLVLQYHHHDPDGGNMPQWTRVVLLNWCAWFLRMRRPGEAKVRLACHNAAKRRRGSLSSLELSVSQGSLRPPPQATNGNLLYVGFRGVEALHYPEPELLCSRLVGGAVGEAGGRGAEAGGSVLEAELNQILEEVRYIAGRFRGQDEKEAACSEWKFAAAVIDRLCLVAFSLFTILCTIGILMSAPNFVEAISKDFFS
ncbi:neuronal acetylcholine receptor subunit alpha-7-like [Etheostoma cragini]|uniref:neuronal acetylcholine receptor subunit alpha-7-like n=1 Tax=Etheostoma cragini TaxID=417921 RepID=UPI00155DF263|nr:neuronal acetylcholine receptor subunit alpha-7-like [Etheostoma cragini]